MAAKESERGAVMGKLVRDKSIKEMADVLELLFPICEGIGHTVEELTQVREVKREKRGEFKDRIYLVGNEE